MSPRASSYNNIIDAAEAVVIEAGASHMTLEAVAARAGISKGGLLHHFPNKVALLVAMVEHQIKMHQDARKKVLKNIPKGPCRELKSFIIAARNRNPMHNRLGASLSAAISHDPRLNEPIQKVIRESYAKFTTSDIGFEKAAIIALAVDGMRLQEMLSISPFNEEEQSRILDQLLRLVDTMVENKNNEAKI
ncbi:MAG: HTH-type transcriptional regulator RutR [Deltaproteobacteria bacterium]|nr:HTH-type transcriptional regulator RutR [Deltaproteobacteria bacterium]